MYLAKFVHTKTGRYLMSIILGLGLASLFRTICKEKNCIIFKAPPLDEMDGKVYKYQDKCYTYKSVSTKCDASKTDVIA
uniref:Uncharacterized protein n=1 Tax=viral metagenome TaxID=1070528 RepID=A0A6C0EVJ4_9ZZZZ